MRGSIQTLLTCNTLPSSLFSRHFGIGFFACLALESLSKEFCSGSVPVDQLVAVEIVFGNVGALPSLLEVMGIERVEAVFLAVVPQDILRQGLDVQIGMVMLEPEIIAEDDHFDQGRVRIEFESDGFAHGFEPLEQSDALPDFFPEGGKAVPGMVHGFDARAGVWTVGIHQEDVRAKALIEDGRQVADLIDEGAVAARSDRHDRAAGALFFFELFDAPLRGLRAPGEKGDETGAGGCGGEGPVALAAMDVAEAGNQHHGDDDFDGDERELVVLHAGPERQELLGARREEKRDYRAQGDDDAVIEASRGGAEKGMNG